MARKPKYYYINGKFVPFDKARIHLMDIGFLRAYSVFEVLRTYNGKPFLFKEHLTRLKKSSKSLGIKIPLNENEIKIIIDKLLNKNKFRESTIRIILTGGMSAQGTSLGDTPTFCILTTEMVPMPEKYYTNGAKLITYNYKREIPETKISSYVSAVKIYNSRLKKEKALEILYIHEGKVLECSTSNFFIIKNDKIITPKNNILLGTTRNLILKLAQKDFKTEERNIYVDELKAADETFITATDKEIVPVIKIDDMIIGNGAVGEKTKRLMDLFDNFVARA